ncbi:MAG: hypothetical protein LRY71_04385 [Bacillaceae bacterium]|nr:hypothetical protein [Bacillaceae bacterium]
MASRISFSYVIGVDPHNPLLPSPYLEHWQKIEQKRMYSASNRFAKQTSATESDIEEKIAYHVGVGKKVKGLSAKLEAYTTSLKKIRRRNRNRFKYLARTIKTRQAICYDARKLCGLSV